jgi:4-aminobutyrate aminotransferase-like enzyme
MAQGTQILSLNRFDAGRTNGLSGDVASLVARRAASFGAASVLFYEQPIVMVRAQGAWMFAADGRRYLDVYNNVPSVGHCHPHVVEAIARQAAVLNTHSRYLTGIVHTYAERLLTNFPAELSNVVLTCTGSESNDLALRLAKRFTGGEGFVVTETAYHGNTSAVTEVSPSSFRSRRVPAHVRTVPAPLSHTGGQDVGSRFAANVREAIEDLERKGVRFAGLLVDSIFSSDGIYADPPGFLRAAIDAVHAAGGVFIADEVQPGFGRTGRHMWGFQRHEVTPDIVTLGKPMGNGFPMGGLVTRPELLAAFCEESGYFNTFGGNPVAAAAGLAVLEVIEREKLMLNAEEVGAYLRAGLRTLATRFQEISDVRGAGLFIGLEFSKPDTSEPATDTAIHVINGMRERGVLIGAAGANGNILKIRPPLCFSRENADLFLNTLDDVMKTR